MDFVHGPMVSAWLEGNRHLLEEADTCEKNRAVRRHQERRKKARVLRQHTKELMVREARALAFHSTTGGGPYWDPRDPKNVGKWAHTPHSCSCWSCRNPRRALLGDSVSDRRRLMASVAE